MSHTWFFKDDDKEIGPIESQSFLSYVENGKIKPDTSVKLLGGEWTKACNIDGLFDRDINSDQASEESYSSTPRREMQGKEIICPHCWGKFPVEEILYIARHPDLFGDEVVPGEFEHLRFLPSRFTSEGHALDARNMVCPDMACPFCHLRIPQTIIELNSLFFSIVGATGSGKSYFLASMVWELRNSLSSLFNFAFSDADPQVNAVINEYEEQLFLNPNAGEVTVVKKTELTGELYRVVKLNNMNTSLPMPFIFKLQPTDNSIDQEKFTKNVILYDNAGEHFQPGREEEDQPATRHLIHSNGIVFLFDPVLDAKMRKEFKTDDPQIALLADKITNQETLLAEMIRRIRLYSDMKTTDRYENPLIITVSKYDLWKGLFPEELESVTPWSCSDDQFSYKFDLNTLMNISFQMRKILIKILPSFVKTAEAFSSRVFFIPASSFGTESEVDKRSGLLGVRPENIKSIWTEIPILILMASYGYIAVNKRKTKGEMIKKFNMTDDSITFTLPGTDELVQLPKVYFGSSLYNEHTKKWFTLPGEFTIALNTKDDTDDAFWDQPAKPKKVPETLQS